MELPCFPPVYSSVDNPDGTQNHRVNNNRNSMRIRNAVLILAGMLVWSGCGSHSSAPVGGGAAGSAAPKSSTSVEGLLGQDASPAPPTPSAPEPSSAPSTATSPGISPAPPAGVFSPRVEEATGQLTMFVQQFYLEYKRMPTSLNELVTTAHYLPYIFPPPKGQKWVIDTKDRSVKLTDQ
jgi:hypothetical protein